jgi:hypothetical protein
LTLGAPESGFPHAKAVMPSSKQQQLIQRNTRLPPEFGKSRHQFTRSNLSTAFVGYAPLSGGSDRDRGDSMSGYARRTENENLAIYGDLNGKIILLSRNTGKLLLHQRLTRSIESDGPADATGPDHHSGELFFLHNCLLQWCS